jgi:hypothetical protein
MRGHHSGREPRVKGGRRGQSEGPVCDIYAALPQLTAPLRHAHMF